jgi:hypothetical protein
MSMSVLIISENFLKRLLIIVIEFIAARPGLKRYGRLMVSRFPWLKRNLRKLYFDRRLANVPNEYCHGFSDVGYISPKARNIYFKIKNEIEMRKANADCN